MALEWNDAIDTQNDRVLVFTGFLSIREARGLAAKVLSRGDAELLGNVLKGNEGLEEREDINEAYCLKTEFDFKEANRAVQKALNK